MLAEELESALRSALARAAADIPDPEPARQRLLQHHYRPGRGHRRLAAGITAASAVAAVVLGLGLAGVFASARPSGAGTIWTTAFTLVEHANGTATLTINPDVLLEPSTLQSDLQHDGIPAMVTTGSFCSSHPAPAGFRQVVTGQRSSPDTMTINPAAMPAGTKLSFGNFKLGSGQETAVTLVDTNSYTCSNVAPHAPRKGDMVVHNLPWGPQAR